MQQQGLTLDGYLWDFVDGQTLQNNRRSMADVPANTVQSDAMAKDLKKRGFRFVGTTVIYSHLQAVGIINGRDEQRGVAKVLNAAALTYVAALVSSLMTLLYYANIVMGRR